VVRTDKNAVTSLK